VPWRGLGCRCCDSRCVRVCWSGGSNPIWNKFFLCVYLAFSESISEKKNPRRLHAKLRLFRGSGRLFQAISCIKRGAEV
jgi:hypothetical protein